MKFFITGGCGFIGNHMARRLVQDGHSVTCYDNMSLGRRELVQDLPGEQCCVIEDDLRNEEMLSSSLKGHDVIIHLAANSDISQGPDATNLDFEYGTYSTYCLLNAMAKTGVRKIIFSSSSAIYGESEISPTPEDYGPLLPISYYGASKLASEGMLSAYSHNRDFQIWIYRFGNVVGSRATHGIIFDFVRKLRENPEKLEILGDGEQTKPYLHVEECIEGMLFGFDHASDPVNVFNLATDGATKVDSIADRVIKAMQTSPEKFYTGGERGWPGDVPRVRMDVQKMTALGWRTQLSSDEAVQKAVEQQVEEVAAS